MTEGRLPRWQALPSRSEPTARPRLCSREGSIRSNLKIPGAGAAAGLRLPLQVIVGADKRVSSAFLATLREEPSSVDLSQAFYRKEKERSAILTVSGLAHAIARAEEHMREQQRARSSQPDIFAALGATDDCAGPAVYRPYVPTPVPPRPVLASADETVVMPRIPAPPALPAPPLHPPSAPTRAPILVLDHGSFYHPAGPIPGFARPSRPRRGALAWTAIAVAPLLALLVLAGAFTFGRTWRPSIGAAMPAAPAKVEPSPSPSTPSPPEAAAPVAPPAETAAEPSRPLSAAEPELVVVDVKSLKPAKPRKR